MAFTLIELLVVIAIIAILAVVVVLVLNPSQLLLQARDSNRLQDLATIQSAIGYYLADAGANGTANLGTPNTVYASFPDAVATSTAGDQCQGVGLPSLPATYSYHCAASSTWRAADGTGWIPVNFRSMSNGSPFGQLPADPANNSSSRLYYTYTTDGQKFELTAALESQKYRLGGTNDAIGTDGGTLATVYEKGSKLGLEPLDYGDPSLVGLWTFDEGAGTIAYDYSGNNATGSWLGTLGSQWVTGRVGGGAGTFNGTNNYVAATNFTSFISTNAYSFSLWFKVSAFSPVAQPTLLRLDDGGVTGGYSITVSATAATTYFYHGSSPTCAVTINPNAWYYFVFVYSGAGINNVTFFINGQSMCTQSATAITQTGTPLDMSSSYGPEMLNGLIDDVRVYNRALSASEVAALYNGGK